MDGSSWRLLPAAPTAGFRRSPPVQGQSGRSATGPVAAIGCSGLAVGRGKRPVVSCMSYNLLRMAADHGLTVGGILLGAAKPAHILTRHRPFGASST